MNTARLVPSGLFSPLQGLLRWLGATSAPSMPRQAISVRPQNAPKLVAACTIPTRVSAPIHAHRKPLRVVRVMEAGQTRTSVGRMVISGRMADVCAELDRLAASEATCH